MIRCAAVGAEIIFLLVFFQTSRNILLSYGKTQQAKMAEILANMPASF
jgi:hypothetical protein